MGPEVILCHIFSQIFYFVSIVRGEIDKKPKSSIQFVQCVYILLILKAKSSTIILEAYYMQRYLTVGCPVLHIS